MVCRTDPRRNRICFKGNRKVESKEIREVLTVILSRTVRSCRATTHADLATLIEPQTTTYYCRKHGKICKPLFTIVSWWERYAKDTIKRLAEFDRLRTDTNQICLNGNSETIDVFAELEKKNKTLADLAKKQKIRGIFSSPPYVGLIDYHEQHAYAYDLFGFERKDAQEIGSMKKRQSKAAQMEYAKGISNVLNNCKKFLVEDFDIFLVANDKYFYPTDRRKRRNANRPSIQTPCFESHRERQTSLFGNNFSLEGEINMNFEEYEDPIEYTVTEDKVFCDFGDLDYDIDGEYATVQAISVYRTGQGIGRKLVELFEERAITENAKGVLVPASPTKEAVSFWKAMNYKPSGEDDNIGREKLSTVGRKVHGK